MDFAEKMKKKQFCEEIIVIMALKIVQLSIFHGLNEI